ncbi:MAG TPA: DUF3160 domain-containing protein [Clostridiales bacterium]|jgi:hypothetical protein|nr:DUF3160 domain-containing protein [Clostridiales bacterium]
MFHDNFKKRILLLTLILTFSLLIAGCDENDAPPENPTQAESQPRAVFAEYDEKELNYKPQVEDYEVEPDLSNVANTRQFDIPDAAAKQLAENAFLVQKSYDAEFYQAYEGNRYLKVPNFITTDSIMHTYHLYFDHLLKSIEEKQLKPAAEKMTDAFLQETAAQMKQLKNKEWKLAAERNEAFFSVAKALFTGEEAPVGNDLVESELSLIKATDGIEISPIMNVGSSENLEPAMEDYSQYIPRGHYTKTEALKNYFKGMMWYGRQTFRNVDDQQLRSAVLFCVALRDNQEAHNEWRKIYDTTSFFAGESDDPSFFELAALVWNVYGQDVKPEDLDDNEKFSKLKEAVKNIKAPAINSVPVFDSQNAEERESKITGFRLMGQRYSIDADIFQQLIYSKVKENSGGELRMLPSAFDIPAAMGSETAQRMLKDSGAYDYDGYEKNMKNLQNQINQLGKKTWTSNLYWAWMYTIKPLTEKIADGFPKFMKGEGWELKNLNTFKASWTELKHDTILYSKQAYAEMGDGGSPVLGTDDRGYVEPVPDLYNRLATLTRMTKNGLSERNLISEDDFENLEKLESLACSLTEISIKELENETLSDEEYELIRSYGGQLEHFWFDVLKNEKNADDRSQLLIDNPAALIADVATDPDSGQVLEEGTGMLNHIYVVVPIDGKLVLAMGSIFTCYEFPWPMSDRLTDEAWRAMLMMEENIQGYFNWADELDYENFISTKYEY